MNGQLAQTLQHYPGSRSKVMLAMAQHSDNFQCHGDPGEFFFSALQGSLTSP